MDSRHTGLAVSRVFAPSKLVTRAADSELDYCAQQIKRAGIYLEKGRIDLAEACLRSGLERVPDHPESVAHLAICLAAGKRKYVTAEKLINNILSNNPYDSTAWYAKGRVNLLGGRREQAFADFEQARKVSRDDGAVESITQQQDPRRAPVLRFLSRGNPLNILLGRLRAHLSR